MLAAGSLTFLDSEPGPSRRPLSGDGWRTALHRFSLPSALLAAGLCIQYIAGRFPSAIERYYSRAWYPRVASFLSFCNRPFPFSVAELLLAIVSLGLAGYVGISLWQVYLKRTRLSAFLVSAALKLLWVLALGLPLFLLIWGFNYERQPVARSFGLVQREATPPELEAIARATVAGINDSYRSAMAQHDARTDQMPLDRSRMVQLLQASFAHVGHEMGFDGDGRVAPKPVYLSHVMTRFGISGMYLPFTGEANYNAEIPDSELPFATAHEMAHAAGFAREDEANFIAFLVCTNSADPYLRYSGYLGSLGVFGRLARVAPLTSREILQTLDAGVVADLKQRSAFWARNLGRATSLGLLINNAYLKANQIKSGVKNYDDSVSLVIGYYLAHGVANECRENIARLCAPDGGWRSGGDVNRCLDAGGDGT